MNPNCVERRDSTVAPQALHLMNNGMVQRLAEDFARRVRREAGDDPAERVERAYQIALSRPPSKGEKQLGLSALARLSESWSKLAPNPEEASLKALTTYCHAMLNSAAFLYID